MAEATKPPVKLWKVAQVAEFLSVSESWVRLHVEKGNLPVCRIGGMLRFVPAEIERYANGAKVKTVEAASVTPIRKP